MARRPLDSKLRNPRQVAPFGPVPAQLGCKNPGDVPPQARRPGGAQVTAVRPFGSCVGLVPFTVMKGTVPTPESRQSSRLEC
jgi:hypothetical protein